MPVAGGDIIIDPTTVGGGARANLEGIYIADGQFKTGTKANGADSKLWMHGSAAAFGGLSLQRDWGGGSANLTTPMVTGHIRASGGHGGDQGAGVMGITGTSGPCLGLIKYEPTQAARPNASIIIAQGTIPPVRV